MSSASVKIVKFLNSKNHCPVHCLIIDSSSIYLMQMEIEPSLAIDFNIKDILVL